MRSSDPLADLVRLERRAVGRAFVAPTLRGRKVRVEIDGLAWQCRCDPDFQGWGRFVLTAQHTVHLEAEATAWERERWADARPRRSLTLVDPIHPESRAHGGGYVWLAWDGERRLVPLLLCGPCERFDAMLGAFDGAAWWCLGPDFRVPPRRARDLRARFESPLGISRRPSDPRPADVLAAGGGSLVRQVAIPIGWQVTWTKGGRTITSIVDRSLAVIEAGFCLSGTDGWHDLASLASLLGRTL
jgi:hypothetical protein